MVYSFEGICFKEGNRQFIKIPFNVWDICEQKGNIPVKVTIQSNAFECKLIPKGEGVYYIPVTKKYFEQLKMEKNYTVSFELIDQLSRINHDSPYSVPIRKIEAIQLVLQPDVGFCGQACMAMLSGLTIEEIITSMKAKKWQVSLSKFIETLDYFSLAHADKMIYIKRNFFQLPNLCLLNVKSSDVSEKRSHFLLYFDKKYYDPAVGILTEYDTSRIIGYLEIFS